MPLTESEIILHAADAYIAGSDRSSWFKDLFCKDRSEEGRELLFFRMIFYAFVAGAKWQRSRKEEIK
jgi:hypothetical protein